jgi:hypothetical protein
LRYFLNQRPLHSVLQKRHYLLPIISYYVFHHQELDKRKDKINVMG